MENTTELEQIASWIREAGRVVALTGAGISTESGIPDFRGPQGVWTKNPEAEKMSHIHYYMTDPAIRVKAWQARLNSPARNAKPNAGHLALAELEKKGRLHTLVTQNVDGLHLLAGHQPGAVIEIHGNMREVMCMECGERAPMERALARVSAGEQDPPCRTCGGILKSATVSFGQPLLEQDVERAELAAATCDVFLAIGSTLEVYPVAFLPEIAMRSGAKLAIFNDQPTRYDRAAAAMVRARLGEVLPRLAAQV